MKQKLIGNPNLHGAQTAIAGMAYFSGTGPLGMDCIECIFVDPKSRKRARGGVIGKCMKYAELMRRIGPAFPLGTASCKYFETSGPQRIRTEDYGRREAAR
jgi:hypothetical protein